ncbi:MAG: metallophosphoesterase [Myxococcaceae bacterium]|nr:MAG: metallophosphoesterase [Myxococcaceae bacterium]
MSVLAFDFETVILRFRDLATQDGETVGLHSKIAREHGYVWWGWWNKGGEQVPSSEFAALLRKAQMPGGLKLYLLDSGHSRTYTANCTDIKWELTGDVGPSPELEKTPAYYSSKSELAWFKLGPIEPCELKTSGFTYVRVDSLFTSQPSRYSAFYGKRIFSAQELTEQNRTIWFVRAAKDTDKQHEVSLLDAATLSPEHFPERFIQSGGSDLLWVSDLHYGSPPHATHGFPLDPKTPGKRTLGQAVQEALESHGVKEVGGVLVSGDISWKAAPREFEEALAFFRWMESSARVTRFQFAVCPGNHDLAYSTGEEGADAKIDFTFADARAAYSDFYARLFDLPPNEYLSCGRRFLLAGSFPIEIVCLNSSLLQQRPGVFRGHGFVGEDQLRDAAKEFGWSGRDVQRGRPFRIVMLHHHLVPVTYRESIDPKVSYSVTLDAEALMRWVVEHRVDLVLHGHMHQPACVRISKPLKLKEEIDGWHDFHVIGMGSTGVESGHQGAIGRNTFGILHFDAQGVRVSVYTVSPSDPSEKLWSVQIPFARP